MDGFEELDRELDEKQLRYVLQQLRAAYTGVHRFIESLDLVEQRLGPGPVEVKEKNDQRRRDCLRTTKEIEARIVGIEEMMRVQGFSVPRWRSREKVDPR